MAVFPEPISGVQVLSADKAFSTKGEFQRRRQDVMWGGGMSARRVMGEGTFNRDVERA